MKGKIVYLCRLIKKYANYVTFVLSGYYFRNKRELSSLKGIYKGKRCFVVCNGPSLSADDLTKIHNHGDISIGINMIGRIYNQTPWRPNILVATDGCIFHPKNKEIVMNCEAGFKSFKRNDYLKTRNAQGNAVYVCIDGSRKLLEHPKFSMDSSIIQFSIGTSAYEAIEWAVHLGCREIYIIGCDMSYAKNMMKDGSIIKNETGKNHFYAMSQDADSDKQIVQTWELQTAFEAAERFSHQYGFRIYNATRGGYCEAFERVNFDSLF